jgi:hypothetical protein
MVLLQVQNRFTFLNLLRNDSVKLKEKNSCCRRQLDLIRYFEVLKKKLFTIF